MLCLHYVCDDCCAQELSKELSREEKCCRRALEVAATGLLEGASNTVDLTEELEREVLPLDARGLAFKRPF